MPSLQIMSPFSETDFHETFDFTELDATVESTCQLAMQHPELLYRFMQRYTDFNSHAGSLVAILAGEIGLLRHLFRDPTCFVNDQADRASVVAAPVFAAAIDEHVDKKVRNASHRTLAQATLKAIGDYGDIGAKERNRIGQKSAWMNELVATTKIGYTGVENNNIVSVIRALGFHAASEFLADREYRIIDKVVRHDHQGSKFDAYLRQVHGIVEMESGTHSAWYWIVTHGEHKKSGVEAEHFQMAIEALNLAARYRPEPENQIREWAMQGFTDFVEIQQRLFREIGQECQEICLSQS